MLYVYLIGTYAMLFAVGVGLAAILYEPTMYYFRLIKDKLTPIEAIEVVDICKKSSYYKMPITIEDVKAYLKEVEKICPRSLIGIEAIILKDREKGMRQSIMACYRFSEETKGKGIIEIYPLQYRRDKNLFAVPYTKEQYPKAILSSEEAKEMQLFSLGHELGHNYFYRSMRQLSGRYLERNCDAFSASLNIVTDPMRNKKIADSWDEWDKLKGSA